MTRTNDATVRRFVEEVLGDGNEDALPDLVAEDYVGHLPLGDHYGLDGARVDVAAWRGAFPDLAVTIEDLIPVRDRVVRRFVLRGTHRGPFLGLVATGRRIKVAGIAIDRLADGRIMESWVVIDLYGLVRQLGGGR